ncbi:MAG: hypothetical protein ACJA0U_001028 [Salibacteraceae bacterium]|jgi:hypothetical protein
MQKSLIILIILFSSLLATANDGAFFAKGNQLIPISESDISVKKEILTLKKIGHDYIEVNVYYEFFNPNDAKDLIVGFEAFSPSGDVNGAPKNGNHPYMNDFTVDMNGKLLKYQIAYVEDSLYLKDNKVAGVDLDKFEGQKEGNYIDFYYVYYFNAHFKKGLNIVKHTYKYDLSGGICYNYNFEYVLTAATRWANKQIDDFTLIIEPDELESFQVSNTFFSSSEDWNLVGIGKSYDSGKSSTFHIRNGIVVFEKNNFKPAGELYVNSYYCDEGAPYSEPPLSYNSRLVASWFLAEDDEVLNKLILRNLPFARRGYIFKTKKLQEYYENVSWYIPDPNYIPVVAKLTDDEIKLIEENK